jgi:hypothetical protein
MAVLLGVVCAFTEANLGIDTRANGQYAFVMLYNIVYGFTWGPMPWLLPAEIFPLRGRSKGMALATTSNWIFNFIIGMVSPDAFAGVHGYFYLIIAGFCLFSAGLAHFYYVETANHTLEEIAVALGIRRLWAVMMRLWMFLRRGMRRGVVWLKGTDWGSDGCMMVMRELLKLVFGSRSSWLEC